MSRVGTRARRMMNVRASDANITAKSKSLDAFFDEFLKNHQKKIDDALRIGASFFNEKETPGRSMGMLAASGFFDLRIRSPHSVVTIDSGLRGRRLFEAPYGIPPLFAPRDNNVEGSPEERKTEREKYDLMSIANTYLAPTPEYDRFGYPTWPENVELVDGRHPDAGAWGKLCYRTACQKPNAFYFNTGSRKHYCKECARLINKENMLGTKLLHLAEKEGEHA